MVAATDSPRGVLSGVASPSGSRLVLLVAVPVRKRCAGLSNCVAGGARRLGSASLDSGTTAEAVCVVEEGGVVCGTSSVGKAASENSGPGSKASGGTSAVTSTYLLLHSCFF